MSRTFYKEIHGVLTTTAAALCLLVAAACDVDPPTAEGRPCQNDSACGPGTHCDVKAGTCVKDSGKDGGGDTAIPPDIFQPDSTKVNDSGGFPTGMTRCGNVCANLKSDKLHCGKCNSACSAEADSCVNGKCACGTTGKVCGPGLDCVSGACKCKKSGRCKGCCDGNICRKVDTMQSLIKCGKGGDACRACKTSTCAITSCKLGGCLNTWQPGKSCNDGKPCTYGDTAARFYFPRGLVVSDATGRVYVADTYNHRIRSIYGSTVTTLAGTGISGLLDGAATSAKFNRPYDVAIHSSGKIYVVDYNNSKLRLITISGVP